MAPCCPSCCLRILLSWAGPKQGNGFGPMLTAPGPGQRPTAVSGNRLNPFTSCRPVVLPHVIDNSFSLLLGEPRPLPHPSDIPAQIGLSRLIGFLKDIGPNQQPAFIDTPAGAFEETNLAGVAEMVNGEG